MKPVTIVHHHFIDKLAVATGVVSGLALYPQVVSAIVTRDISGLSFLSFFVIFANSTVWTIYAIHRRIPALIISSVLNALASAILMVLIV